MCECINVLNRKLAEMPGNNTEISVFMMLDNSPTRVMLRTQKRDDSLRVKPLNVMPSYCPFCGEEYSKERPQTLRASAEIEAKNVQGS